jgi:hypothetical protein
MDDLETNKDIITITLSDPENYVFSGNIDMSTTMNHSGVYTINVGNDTIDFSNILTGTQSDITFGPLTTPVTPFENGFPDWKDFNDMCKEYPGLEKTYEHLKTFYNLCKSEWDSKKNENNN